MNHSSVLYSFAMIALFVGPVAAGASYPLAPTAPPVSSALAFLRSQQVGDGSIGTPSVTAWVVMAIAAAGQDPNTWVTTGGESPVDYLAQSMPRLQVPTDWERQLLAATAAHQDPHNFGGADLVATVQSFYSGGQFGSASLLNDDFFAILSLRSAGITAADASLVSSQQFILTNQNADGGWSYQVGGVSDVDDTAAALMALAHMGYPSTAPGVQNAISYLRTQQLPDGGLPSVIHGGTVSNTASDSWAIDALVLYGQDPSGTAWTTPSGATLVGNLLSLQQSDGSFQWDGVQRVGPIWMTAYAVPALVGHPYPVNL
ncbi:MAG: hypothetical protein ACYDBQ_02265 [Thermoplasmatota archaeon]